MASMASTANIQKDSRGKIEQLGLEAVPSHLKQTPWYDFMILQMAFSVNSGNFLVPALAVISGGLSFYAAAASTMVGAAFAFLFVSFLTLPGSRYGLPAQYAIRSMLGTGAARYISSPIRTLTSLYWFAVQTIGGTAVLTELGSRLFSVRLPFLAVSVCLALIMAILALVGFDAVKKATRYFMPFLLIGQAALFVLLIQKANQTDHSTILTHGSWEFSSFLFYSSLAFVQYVSGLSASSDMARYAKSERGAFWGLFSGNTAGFAITAVLGALSASLLGELNPFVSASTLTSSVSVLVLIFACAMMSMISINLNNAYTGGFSLLNTFQGLGRIKSACLFGLAAVILSCFPDIVESAQKYISLLGTFVIPISAVIAADFLFIKRRKLTEADLLVLREPGFVNKQAIISMAFGIISYSLLPENASPGFVSFIATASLYICLQLRKGRQ
ncbi:purine-cytosine permease family protein [Bacillus infantis]|nr:cytosine permease [Bacillus infantis]